MTELEKYIQSYFGVTREEGAQVTSYFEASALSKGDFFLKPGRICNKLSFIQSGLIRVYLNTEMEEVTQWIGTKGSFITYLLGLIFNHPDRLNIQVLSYLNLFSIIFLEYKYIVL